MLPRARSAAAVVAALAVTAAFALVPAARAQVPPLDAASTTTSTTAPPETTTTAGPTQPPPQDSPPPLDGSGSAPAPPGAKGGGDDTAAPSGGKIAIPLSAQAIINSVRRSGPSNTDALLQGVAQLEQLGLSPDEAVRVGLGRFPIAGSTRYTHDWLFPRYGPGFRFHLGNDLFAAYGTPVRAPVDGVVHSGDSGLGGLYVKVVMPDGTYFYLAHLSRLPDGFVDGAPVKTGDVVGYVGDSGNARGGAPHLHIEVHPKGGPAIDPKPVMDRFLMEALARIPALVEHYKAAAPAAPPPSAAAAPSAAARPLLATALLRDRTTIPAVQLPTEVLFASAGNPAAGAVQVLDAEAAAMAHAIDWEGRADLETARLDLLTRFSASLRQIFDPLLAPEARDTLVDAVTR